MNCTLFRLIGEKILKNLQTNIYLYKRNPGKNTDFKVWLAFPGPESFALSSLGFLWMYKSIDETDDIGIETICSGKKNTQFKTQDISMIGFSFTFDMDIFTILEMLQERGIPLLSSKRGDNFPVIFAGGSVVTANPEPYADFFDFFIIGDGEDLNLKVLRICKEHKSASRCELLEILAQIDGVYVPSLHQKSVKKITKYLDECIYTPILSSNAFFKNTFIVEVERGCANRCGFCLASYLNLPVRFVPYEKIIDTIELGLKFTNKIALLGAQITAHPHFKDICKYIYNKIQNGQKINMSISSMRIDAFCSEIVKTLVAAGQKNTTLAIEAGSERLRSVINKNLTEEQIFNAIDIAKENGLKGFKFYGMIGLPTETSEDLDEMIKLAAKIKEKHRGFDISFGFSSFVPKPNTPFQWCGREDIKSLEKKVQYLKKEFHKIGVKAQFSSIKWDYWQAVLSRGDRKLTDFILDVYRLGYCLGSFKTSAKNNMINSDFYALNTYPYETRLVWDFIETKPGKDFLINESKKLLSENRCMI